MTPGLRTWVVGALMAAAPLASGNEARAQDFKIPLNFSHFVFRGGEDLAEIEELRGWTLGLGMMIGVQHWGSAEQRGIYGFMAQATYGGPYWYFGGGAGMWNSGSTTTDNFGFGLTYHYNVFQSRDYRTRLGPEFGWSTASDVNGRTHAWTYRAVMSHTLSPTLSLYGGMGADTNRFSNGGISTRSTNPSLLAGINARLGQGFALSTGVESVFSDPTQLYFSGSIHYDRDRDDGDAGLSSPPRGLLRRPFVRR